MDNYEKEIVSKPAKPELPYSPALSCGPFVFISGSVGRDPANGHIAKGDVDSQTRQTMANIASHLEKAAYQGRQCEQGHRLDEGAPGEPGIDDEHHQERNGQDQ